MTSAMVSAMLLRDLICGVKNPYADVFDPGRFDAAALAGIAAESGQAVKGLAKELFQIPSEKAAAIPRGARRYRLSSWGEARSLQGRGRTPLSG